MSHSLWFISSTLAADPTSCVDRQWKMSENERFTQRHFIIHIFTWDGHLANDHVLPSQSCAQKYSVINEGENDNFFLIQPHMLSGTLAFTLITVPERIMNIHDMSWIRKWYHRRPRGLWVLTMLWSPSVRAGLWYISLMPQVLLWQQWKPLEVSWYRTACTFIGWRI